MRKISINQKEIFEIAYFVKQIFPYEKVYLHFHKEKVVIKITKPLEVLKIEELKSSLKLKYPYLNFIIQGY